MRLHASGLRGTISTRGADSFTHSHTPALHFPLLGKTTLLNLIADRGGVRESSQCFGTIRFNGQTSQQFQIDSATPSHQPLPHPQQHSNHDANNTPGEPIPSAGGSHSQNSILANRIAYVLQQDYLLPHLTVFETLYYAARFRLPRSLSDAEKRERVESLIRELNLSGVRDSLIGDEKIRGIR